MHPVTCRRPAHTRPWGPGHHTRQCATGHDSTSRARTPTLLSCSTHVRAIPTWPAAVQPPPSSVYSAPFTNHMPRTDTHAWCVSCPTPASVLSHSDCSLAATYGNIIREYLQRYAPAPYNPHRSQRRTLASACGPCTHAIQPIATRPVRTGQRCMSRSVCLQLIPCICTVALAQHSTHPTHVHCARFPTSAPHNEFAPPPHMSNIHMLMQG